MVEPKDCLFCKIVAGEIPAKKVYEDSNAFAFLDINPRNPGHTLVIPKNHYETLFEMPDSEAGELFRVVKRMADSCRSGMKSDGVSVCQSNGRAAGQIVQHLHFHVIPRFASEGPVGLEGILPVKKMDEAGMDRIAESIQKAAPSGPEPGKPAKAPAKKADSGESGKKDEIDFSF
jgi:histidine triad (HIT) family protein